MLLPRARMSGESGSGRLYLVDGSGYLFRAFHALPALTSRSGLPTGAVYGFTTMLNKLLRTSDATHVAVVLDAPGRTFRDDAFQGYKATRAEMPSELALQLPYAHRVVRALGMPLLEIPGVEADDVIGTLAARAAGRGIEVVIVTSDKDMMQLVGPRVSLLDTMHDRVTRAPEVQARFGVDPERIVEVMGLMGDSIDNIPGVKGIGEKTASRLIAHFGTIDAVYARLDEIDGLGLRGAARIRGALEAGREAATMSRYLATIRCDLPLEIDLDSLVRAEPDRPELQALAQELEFSFLVKEVARAGARDAEQVAVEVVGAAGIDGALSGAAIAAIACLYGEAQDAVPARLAGVAVAVPGEGPVRYAEVGPDGPPRALLDVLRGKLEGRTVLVDDLKAALHGAALDCEPLDGGTPAPAAGAQLELYQAAAAVGPEVDDASLASYVLDPSRRAHTVDALALDRLSRTLPPAGTVEPAVRAASVAAALLELGPGLVRDIDSAGMGKLYREVEVPLARVLARVEARGILIDRAALEQTGRELRAAAERLEREICELAGGPFNLQSPIQLREVLFERLKLPTRGIRKGKTGLSVDADVLGRLAEQHPIAGKLIEHRVLAKLISTYVNGLLELVDPDTGRLRTSFNQTIAATGRLSSSEPNLQNIPVRTAEGRRIRAAFVAPAGMQLLAADYSQIELRVLAHLTGDPVLLEAFRAREDIHRRTAAEVWGVAPAEVTPEMRRQAKVINFGIIYGMGPQRLSRELSIPLADADAYIKRYFARYPRVKEFADRVVRDGRKQGFVTTLIGRRRYLPDLNAREPNLRQAAERMAWNSPIQGTAADIIKLAMLGVERAIARAGLGTRMLLQVHDELVFEVPEAELEGAGRLVRSYMESVLELAVPLVVDIKRGPSWAALE
ncbi:MAG TPA: DNA polymerase I [Candidatus Bathyarchaeia archaeon]|nr:DNA polymerase I [Candidatus Bathyarchaeia archaeon]